MEISKGLPPLSLRANLLKTLPVLVFGRVPNPQTSLFSRGVQEGMIRESFESLLHRGGKIILETPVRLFSFLPFQHLAMNFGLLNFLGAQGSFSFYNPNLGRQFYLGGPLFPRSFQQLIQGLKILKPSRESTSPYPLPDPAPGFNTGINQNSAILESAQADLQRKIFSAEPEIQQKLNEVNSKRAQQGQAHIDFKQTTSQIESIMNDLALSDKQKKEEIGALRKELGLSKKDMKKLFTKRLAKIYQEAASQLKTFLNRLKDSVTETEKTFGKDSPQAAAARQQYQAAQNQWESTLQKWEHQASLYKNLFPSFWSKIGGFFKKIGKGLLKMGKVFSKFMNFVTPFLRFIPGIGQMVAFGWGALKGLVQAIQGNWKGFLGGLFSFAGKIAGLGSIFSAFSNLSFKALPIARSLFEAARGNFTPFLQWSGTLLSKIPGVAPFLSKTSDYLSYLISPLRSKNPDNYGIPPGAEE